MLSGHLCFQAQPHSSTFPLRQLSCRTPAAPLHTPKGKVGIGLDSSKDFFFLLIFSRSAVVFD